MDYAVSPNPPGSLQFLAMAQDLMNTHNLSFPTSVKEALDVYVTMTTIVEQHM